jgi:hypothetical protein
LLIEKGFLNNFDLSIYNQNLRISPQTENKIISQLPCDIQSNLKIWWAGRDDVQN